MAKKTQRRRSDKIALIASKDPNPAVKVKPGMKLRVVSVSLVDPSGTKVDAVGARLCGGTSTCLALVDIQA